MKDCVMGTRWIVTGSKGQLGRALGRALAASPSRELVAAVDLPEVDIADPEAVRALSSTREGPAEFVVNAAAFTHVDRCETERELAHRVNAVGAGLLSEACAEAGSVLAHVSTDYVFAGDRRLPYREEDPPAPASAYGETKLEGERRVLAASEESLVVRTSWVFGEGRNFIGAILGQADARRAGRASGPLAVVDDQHGRPTYAEDLAEAIIFLLEQRASGLYHVANAGVATWWDLARVSLDLVGCEDLSIERIQTKDLDLPAQRPLWSVLDCSKAESAGLKLRSWEEALREYLNADFSPIHGPRED
jgi:dTDP-4-dehydrorhamnose reductase